MFQPCGSSSAVRVPWELLSLNRVWASRQDTSGLVTSPVIANIYMQETAPLKGALNPKFMLTSKCRQIYAIKKSEFIICITCSILKIFPVEAVIKASLQAAMFFAALTSEYVVGSDLDHMKYSLIGTNMPYCIAFGCNNSTDRLCPGVSFHHLPVSDPPRLKAWLAALKLVNPPVHDKNTCICSEHFLPDCFTTSMQERLMGVSVKLF